MNGYVGEAEEQTTCCDTRPWRLGSEQWAAN